MHLRRSKVSRGLTVAGAASLLVLAGPTCASGSGIGIGIDLGTSYSSVGAYVDGKVEIIANDRGNRITPSYVAFTDSGRLIGEAAKDQTETNPMNTIFGVKRSIGRDRCSDREFGHLGLPCTAARDFEVQMKEKVVLFAPEEITAMILDKMKETAESHLGKEVARAVIAVPAGFNDAQRQATEDAATIAGLGVLRIINEPTAAAIAYAHDMALRAPDMAEKERTVLVYDLGGGTFDVSLISVHEGVVEVFATSGETDLGGMDFDTNVIWHFVKLFKEKTGKDCREDLEAMSKLRREVEKAKRTLSSRMSAQVKIDNFFEGIDFSETLDRTTFEGLNDDLFRRTLSHVKRVLSRARKEDVDDIVLVGGSTHIPKIQQQLESFFDGKRAIRLNIGEAVAYGATIVAGIMWGEEVAGDIVYLDTDVVRKPVRTSTSRPTGQGEGAAGVYARQRHPRAPSVEWPQGGRRWWQASRGGRSEGDIGRFVARYAAIKDRELGERIGATKTSEDSLFSLKDQVGDSSDIGSKLAEQI